MRIQLGCKIYKQSGMGVYKLSKLKRPHWDLLNLVGAEGLEPPTSSTSRKRY